MLCASQQIVSKLNLIAIEYMIIQEEEDEEDEEDEEEDEEDDYGVLWDSGDVGGFECFIEVDQDAENAEAAEVCILWGHPMGLICFASIIGSDNSKRCPRRCTALRVRCVGRERTAKLMKMALKVMRTKTEKTLSCSLCRPAATFSAL